MCLACALQRLPPCRLNPSTGLPRLPAEYQHVPQWSFPLPSHHRLRSALRYPNRVSNTHQSKKSPSNSVGAREVRSGGEGLYGRPRPVPCAHLWGNALTPPAPGDHKGPPFPTSSALAPTDHPASSLSSRLGLMPIRSPNRVSSHRAPCEAVSHVVIGALIMRGMRRRDIQRRIAPKESVWAPPEARGGQPQHRPILRTSDVVHTDGEPGRH